MGPDVRCEKDGGVVPMRGSGGELALCGENLTARRPRLGRVSKGSSPGQATENGRVEEPRVAKVSLGDGGSRSAAQVSAGVG